jgi:hypothetical protein
MPIRDTVAGLANLLFSEISTYDRGTPMSYTAPRSL